MYKTYGEISLYAARDASAAADIFADELRARTGDAPVFKASPSEADIVLRCDETISNPDAYRISGDDTLRFEANGVRGLLYAVGRFLRKTTCKKGKISLIEDIRGDYKPYMQIRGHQIGYRTTANTYDAWTKEQYLRYCKDMMFFGVNTVEHIPDEGKSRTNALMRYGTVEMSAYGAEIAETLDLDVSLWCPNYEKDADDAKQNKAAAFRRIPRVNAVFSPGADPGDLPPEQFMRRVTDVADELQKTHPAATVWPSAQAPHNAENWGDAFLAEMRKMPRHIGGVIQGPNRAMELDELRRGLPAAYPIRLYPDITHNVRCEYPVHFLRDDWHYAYAATESRECVNPRPKELRLLHRLTRGYIVGSVSYSEGINDDLNKMIWSDMDYFGETNLRTSVSDYVRLFFPGCDTQILTDAIFGLEENWESDPAESASVEPTLAKWLLAGEMNPELYDNWRYVMHLFRATCDMTVRERRIFEQGLIAEAHAALRGRRLAEAESILRREYPESCKRNRAKLDVYAKTLFSLIGLQLDVNAYHADSWERGATLETIDMPVTNRAYYLDRLEKSDCASEAETIDYMLSVFERTKTERDEFYFSVAEHGTQAANAPQAGYPYINFKGDDPTFAGGRAPMEILKVFDNDTFRLKAAGLDTNGDYEMRVVYLSKRDDAVRHHKITINGKTIYDGAQFGPADRDYDSRYLPRGFESAVYPVPADALIGGCADIEFSEPTMGVMISEVSIRKKKGACA